MWGAIIGAVASLASSIFGFVSKRKNEKKAQQAWLSAGDIGNSVANAATSIGGLISSRNLIGKQNAWNAEQAQLSREWNLDMDNTKYQRTVADMQAAGVNPALAIDGNLSTQATSNATAQQTDSGLNALTALVKLAGDLKYRDQELKQNKELKERELDIAQQNADTNANVGGATAESQRALASATTIANKYADEKYRLANDLLKHQIDYEEYMAKIARIDSEIKEETKDSEIAIKVQELLNMETIGRVYEAQIAELNARTSKEWSEKSYIDTNCELLDLVKVSQSMQNTYDAYCLENNLPSDQPIIVMTYRQAQMNQEYWASKGDYKQSAAFAEQKNKIRQLCNRVSEGKMTNAERSRFWVSEGRGLIGDIVKGVGFFVGAKGVFKTRKDDFLHTGSSSSSFGYHYSD